MFQNVEVPKINLNVQCVNQENPVNKYVNQENLANKFASHVNLYVNLGNPVNKFAETANKFKINILYKFYKKYLRKSLI